MMPMEPTYLSIYLSIYPVFFGILLYLSSSGMSDGRGSIQSVRPILGVEAHGNPAMPRS